MKNFKIRFNLTDWLLNLSPRHLNFSIFILFFCLISITYVFAEKDDDIIYHKGIPCCKCFVHCRCFGEHVVPDISCKFPDDTPKHPLKAVDKAWHEFMRGFLIVKREGPFLIFGSHCPKIERFVEYDASSWCMWHIHTLSDYLNILSNLRKVIKEARDRNIANSKKWYPSPNEKQRLDAEINRINKEFIRGNEILDEIPSKVIFYYKETLKACTHSDSLISLYNQGLINSCENKWECAVDKMFHFIELAKKLNMPRLLDSKFYEDYGESCLEVNSFHKAIEHLTKAIEIDPQNKRAYFKRAAAYFEIGNFDQALADYIASDNTAKFHDFDILGPFESVCEFDKGFSQGLKTGLKVAANDFSASLCNSIHGLNRAFWALVEHPLQASLDFSLIGYRTTEAMVDWLSKVDKEKLQDLVLIDEFKQLYDGADQLNFHEKGDLFGQAIGKYGIDICLMVGGGAVFEEAKAALTGASVSKALKEANIACNLEAIAVSEINKEAILSSALKHAAERETYLKNVKIHWDRQNKHIPDKHNFNVGKGTVFLESSELEILIKENVGKGQRIVGEFGTPGYRERIDFGKIIGEYALEVKGQPTMYLPTTKGIIHYAKDGKVHLVPSDPNGVIK